MRGSPLRLASRAPAMPGPTSSRQANPGATAAFKRVAYKMFKAARACLCSEWQSPPLRLCLCLCLCLFLCLCRSPRSPASPTPVMALPEARLSLVVPASAARLTLAPTATRHAQRDLWEKQCLQHQPGCATPAWARMPLSAEVEEATSSAPLAPSPRMQLPLQPRRRRKAPKPPAAAQRPLYQMRPAHLPSPRPLPPVPPPQQAATAAWKPDLRAR